LRAFEHDRTEGAGGDDGARPGRLKLLEPHVADPRARLLFLVGEQKASAGAAAEGVVAIAFGLDDVGAKTRQQRTGLVNGAGVPTQIAGIVKGQGLAGPIVSGARMNSGALSS